jgi:hypothetical protein
VALRGRHKGPPATGRGQAPGVEGDTPAPPAPGP